VSRLLHLVVHSLYSNKEIFLRELISNASDALDKLRFKALTDSSAMGGDPTLEIRVVIDEEKGTLAIEDTGIGMTEAELVENLGTIAHSGSRAFLEKLAKEGGNKPDLIGQFGVGFYSAYLVADRVEVLSKAAGQAQAFRWSSAGEEGFTVEAAEREGRGTSVILYVRDEQKEFLQAWRLRELVQRWSDFVGHPIKLEKPDGELETVNKASALWVRGKSEIGQQEYDEFYRHLTHDDEAPLAHTHFKVEGNQEFTALLYVPRHPEQDLFGLGERKRGLRLFVKRVFIMEGVEELLPEWLRFLRGVVDSDDLPLNVSRELLQDSATSRVIKKQLVKRALELLEELAKDAPEDYATFWKGFGPAVKAGIATDWEYRERLAGLARFESTATPRAEQGAAKMTSLADYVSRMKEGQPAIYWVFGESRKALEGSPHLEALVGRGYEVLFLTDPVDEYTMDSLRSFQEKPLISAMRADLKLDEKDDGKAAREAREAAMKPFLDKVKGILGDHVEDVKISERLADSPACLVVAGGGSHAFVERLLRERGRAIPRSKRVLELNPAHPLVETLHQLHEKDAGNDRLREWVETLYDQALLTEGGSLEDPNRFARRLTALLTEAAKRA
jgi:molecular chaperone HtpG